MFPRTRLKFTCMYIYCLKTILESPAILVMSDLMLSGAAEA